MRKGFTLTEVLISLLIISIIYLITLTGLSAANNQSSITTNNLRTAMILNYLTRNIQNLKMSVEAGQIEGLKDRVNQYFSSEFVYPRVSLIQQESSNQYYRRFKVVIETTPGKFSTFYVYQGY